MAGEWAPLSVLISRDIAFPPVTRYRGHIG